MLDLRPLGAVRLSRSTDASTSPTRQTSWIHQTTQSRGFAEPVYVATDLDVSGAVSPFTRPNLGPWLTDPVKIAQWDVLVALKLDRISRSAKDTVDLLEWAQKHNKRIIAGELDSGTEFGAVWLMLAAVFAQVERTNTKERVLATGQYLRQEGRWPGGRVPYGYRKVKAEGKNSGWRLEPDPEESKIVREIMERVLADDPVESLDKIAADLTARGVPAPGRGVRSRYGTTGTIWWRTSLSRIMRNPALRGFVVHNGAIEWRPDGTPARYGEGILDAGEFELLQEELDNRGDDNPRVRRDSPYLAEVAYCVNGHKLVAGAAADGTPIYRCARYKQPKDPCIGGVTTIRRAPVEKFAEREFLALFGNFKMTYVTVMPGYDPSPEIRETTAAIKRLDDAWQAGVYEDDVDEYASRRKALRSRVQDLEATPASGPREVRHETDVTYAQEWDLAGLEERRRMMVSCHFRVIVGSANGRNNMPPEERIWAEVGDHELFAQPEDLDNL